MNGNGQAEPKGKEPVERVVDLFVHMPIGFAVMAWKRVPEFVVSVPGMVGEVLSKGCAQIADAEGRLSEEVRKARMIGQVAVTFGGRQLRREVDARLRDARQAAEGVVGSLPGAGGGASNGAGTGGGATATATPAQPASPSDDAAEPASASAGAAKAPRAPTKPTGARKTTKASPAKAAPSAESRATPAKAAKAPGAAKAPARATAGPAAASAASAAALPIREYDGLSASQVVSRLTGLTPDELRAIRAYEDGSRGRRTVLLAIDRLLG